MPNAVDLAVYLITDSAMCGRRGLVETVALAMRGGVTAVQLRDKGAPNSLFIEQGRVLKRLLEGSGIR